MKDIDNTPTWFLLLSLVSAAGLLYFSRENKYLVDAMGMMYPYTVEGLKQRGHPVPESVQATADAIDAKNKACFGNWDDPNHWS